MKRGKFSIKTQYIIMCLMSMVSVFAGLYAQEIGSTFIKAAAIILPMLSCVLLDSKDTFLLIGMLLPANRVLTLGGCSVLILIALVTVLKEFMTRDFFVSRKILLASLIFVLYASIVSQGGQLFGAAKVILMLFYFIHVLNHVDTKQLLTEQVSSIAFGIIMGSAMNMLVVSSGGSGVSRFRIGENGGNILGIECGILAVCLLVMLLQGLGSNLWMCTELIVVLFIGLMTASKSFLLALLIGGAWILLFILYKSTTKQARIVVFGIFGLAVGFVMLLAMGGTFYSYCVQMLHRIVSPAKGDISNGRIAIWMQYFEVFQNHPRYLWLGNLNYLSFGIEWVAHNMIIEQIAEYGIIGSAILTYLYVRVFKELNKVNQCRYKILAMTAAPLVAFLAVSMASHTLLGFSQTLLLFVCWMCGAQSSDKTELKRG